MIDPATPPSGVIARKGAYRFLEERTARPGSPEVLLLHRESALPLARVPPSEYAGVAAEEDEGFIVRPGSPRITTGSRRSPTRLG